MGDPIERGRFYPPVTPEEYWTRRDQDDQRWERFDSRLEHVESLLGSIVTVGRWIVGIMATAAAASIADIVSRGIHP